MKHPKLKFNENHQPIIEGDFEFEVGPTICDPYSMEPLKKISFAWSVELAQDIEAFHNSKNIPEMLGEKLKQDFIKLMTTGVADEKSAAKAMIWKVFIGLVFILAAWIIVGTIIKALLQNPSSVPVQININKSINLYA